MSGRLPPWQLVGPDAPVIGWKPNFKAVIIPGPGNRIEFIGPCNLYNWAEGSRAIEARKGAAAMRHKQAQRDDWDNFERMRMLLSLQTQLDMLGIVKP